MILERELHSKEDTVSLNSVNTGGYFGEISLFHEAPWSVTATATKPTKLLKLDCSDFEKFAVKNPDLLIKLNRVLSQRLIEAHDKITEVSFSRRKKPKELQKLYDGLDF